MKLLKHIFNNFPDILEMDMKKINLLILCAFCIVFAGCNGKKIESENKSEINSEKEVNIGEKTASEISPSFEAETADSEKSEEENLTDSENSAYKILEQGYFGTILQTNVIADGVPVRSLPDDSSSCVHTAINSQLFNVTGYSDSKDEIDGFSGYWVKAYACDEQGTGKSGWIFSKYINVKPEVDVTDLEYKETLSQKDTTAEIYVQFNRHTDEKDSPVIKIYAERIPSQDFYTFRWSQDEMDFFYCDPVGTFAWYPETNEIKHISYFGGESCESSWTLVSDDGKHLIQDFGTSPGLRGLWVINAVTGEKEFSGSYYKDIEYSDNEITVAVKYNESNINDGRLNEEAAAFAKDYEETTELTDDEKSYIESGLSVSTVVRFRYNLNDKVLYIKDCIRVVEQ